MRWKLKSDFKSEQFSFCGFNRSIEAVRAYNYRTQLFCSSKHFALLPFIQIVHAILKSMNGSKKGKSISCASHANTMPFPFQNQRNRNSLLHQLRNNWYEFLLHACYSIILKHSISFTSSQTDFCMYFLIGIVIVIKPFPLYQTRTHATRTMFSECMIFKFPYIINVHVQCNKYTKTFHILC